MKIIIFGCKGMLGRYVEKYFREKNYEVAPYSRAEFDIHNSFVNERLYTDLMNIITNGAMVINCAGITNKRPDISLSEMYIVNTIFPLILDRVCYDVNAVLLHISTD
jgi:dTDP-4-dehydrorhamnose reductase